MPDDKDYYHEVESAVDGALASGLRDFGALVAKANGADPSLVWRMLKDKDLSPTVTASAIAMAAQKHHEEHALDFEWRFAGTFRHALAAQLEERGGSVALLGASSVASSLLESGADLQWCLVDRSPLALLGVPPPKRHQVDLNTDCRALLSGITTVLMDPPWYPSTVRRWIANALNWMAPEGTLISTLWPDLTRPTARVEKEELLQELSRVGQLKLSPGAVTYETPTFECSNLLEENVPVLGQWRKADLITLVKKSEQSIPAPELRIESCWRRYAFGRRQVALRVLHGDRQQPTMSPIDLRSRWRLKSVSRRDPERQLVGVWSSTGFAARVTGYEHFKTALDVLAGLACEESESSHAALMVLKDRGVLPETLSFGEAAVWDHAEWQ